MQPINKPFKNRNRGIRQNSNNRDNFERAKNIATIISAIAIPIIITIAGYFIQKQISDAGLRKDYVLIASNILKDNPKNQEPDLREWAIKILEDNSPIPFTKKAKDSLLLGKPIIMPGPAWIGPPKFCRAKPKPRTLFKDFEKTLKEIETLESEQKLDKIADLLDKILASEGDVIENYNKLNCILRWVDLEEKWDIDYRKSIGALPSKKIYEEFQKAKKKSDIKK